MIILGEVGRKRKETIRFKDWVQNNDIKKIAGEYLVKYIMFPSKFPSGALIFDAGDYNVKITVNADTLKAILKELGYKKGQDIPNKALYFILDNDGRYAVDIRGTQGAYVFRSTHLKWLSVDELEESEEDYGF